MRLLLIIHVYLVSLLFSGCASYQKSETTVDGAVSQADDGLYRALGGLEGIEGIADQFLFRLSGNDKIVHFWQNTNIERFRTQFVSHLCELSGGPCRYEGDSMADVHRGMDIRQSHFNSVAETLALAMEDQGIPTAAVNALLARLAPLHDAVRNQTDH